MRRWFLGLAVALLTFLAFGVKDANAKILSSETGTVTVAKGEVVNDDLFINAPSVEIEGTVNGDVFMIAQTARVLGTINGSLHAAGQNINLGGSIRNNAYVVGQEINAASLTIGGSFYTAGQNIGFDKTSIVTGSLFSAGASIKIDSQIRRNAYLATRGLTLGDNTVVSKDLYYAGQEGMVVISPKAKITGQIYKTEAKVSDKEIASARKNVPQAIRSMGIIGALIAYLSALLVGYLYFKFFNKHFIKTANYISSSFIKALGIGFLAFIAFFPGVIILLITLIGAPVAGLAILIFLLFAYLTKLVVGLAIGNWMGKQFNWKLTTFKAFMAGLFIFYLVRMIPVVGGLAGFIVFLSGLGALILQTFSQSKSS